MVTRILKCSTLNSPGMVAADVEMVVGMVGVVQSLSSSGQSSKPSHQDVALMQMLLVGQRTVLGGQGLQMQPQEGVSTLCRPCNQYENELISLFILQHLLQDSTVAECPFFIISCKILL